jgi:hypothetical protein
MTDTDREFQSRFDAYRRGLSGNVRPPGAEAVHRTVLRRQRRRTAVAGALAVVALIVALAQFAVDRGPDSAPIGPPGPSVTGTPSPVTSASPSASPSSASPSSASPSSKSSSSRPPASVPPAEQVPPSRTFAVVDGYELHVVALPEVRLQPVDGLYRGIVYVDVYNSGRQPSNYDSVYITEPPGVDWDSPDGYPTMGGCVGVASPETWGCGLEGVPAAGGYRRLPFTVKVNVAPGRTTQTVDGFAIRVMPEDQTGKPTDATPADNKVTVRLVLPPG